MQGVHLEGAAHRARMAQCDMFKDDQHVTCTDYMRGIQECNNGMRFPTHEGFQLPQGLAAVRREHLKEVIDILKDHHPDLYSQIVSLFQGHAAIMAAAVTAVIAT